MELYYFFILVRFWQIYLYSSNCLILCNFKNYFLRIWNRLYTKLKTQFINEEQVNYKLCFIVKITFLLFEIGADRDLKISDKIKLIQFLLVKRFSKAIPFISIINFVYITRISKHSYCTSLTCRRSSFCSIQLKINQCCVNNSECYRENWFSK